ncbi:uncharacterized protein HMPREF1541_08127 [Cyphellophora europaea CBS 101466]|uniref:BTB domain-containing protein n=1 Tax=Cyphellophora europaea (strain CBS 101466) TaxID=1220924 RepID=W2RKW7_CYPE1|nr:uncharacterized protein HMPREF1541_08127 [Cyphellophora europaea CBS 101466]ETN37137.1 hypothetical protein HMPREF1541_08127 [Cyphellophora europaea CBS 101466]
MVDLEGATQVPETAEDVEMGAEDDAAEIADEPTGDSAEETVVAAANPQTAFIDYLRSPVVKLVIGDGEEQTTLSAHRAILERSPFFQSKLATLAPSNLSLSFPEESLDAFGCFLQYQYTGEYFPRRLTNVPDGLETDPNLPSIDDTGEQLLKHARVYTLAEKLQIPELKTLAHSKIHRINSTAVGEIAYARYVYANTLSDDVTIRKPVAAFWATRSHVLRHEAEAEFKAMCLEYPQFGFDVLSLVLDQREKRAREREEDSTPSGSKGRKRMRPSVQV